MDDAVAAFVNVTGASAPEAQAYLTSANNDLEAAVTTFFAAQDGGDDDDAAMAGEDDFEPAPPSTSSAPPARAPAPPSNRPRVATLGTLGSGAGDDGDDDSSDEDKARNLFAGGEKSGINVQDPNAGKKKDDSIVGDLLKKAAEGSLKRQQARPAAGPSFFRGSGNTLGSDEVQSKAIPDPKAKPAQAEDDDDDEEATVTKVLTFWRNGFSIDDGELMSYSEHAETLQQLRDGRAPPSLLGVSMGQRVDVRVADRQKEEYVAPPKVQRAFEGQGNRLGAPSPAASASSARPATGSVPPQPTQTVFEVDNSQPTTNLQLRLGDGSRIVGRFNHNHTVGDIMSYINASHAGVANRSYILQTTFPTRDLTDKAQTIKDANLLGSVVVMRYQ